MTNDPMTADIPLPLLPLLMLASYLLVAGASLALRNAMHGRWSDDETARRGASAMLPMGARMLFAWALQPIWVIVRWTGIPANGITTLATLLGFGSGLAAAAGDFALAGWLYLAAGICDVLDGRVARASGSAGPRGAAIDSVLDRYSDAAVLLGLAWHFRGSLVLLLALAALVGSLLVSYIRARGEGLGVDVKIGWMQRPERVVVLGAGLALSAPLGLLSQGRVGPETIATFALAFVAVMTQATSVQRLVFVIGKLSAKKPPLRARWRQLAAAGVSSTLATALDFALVTALVTLFDVSAWRATALGCLLGGALNFSLNRWWTFGSRSQPVPQLMRYTIVSVSSALFNSGGVALLLALPIADYRLAWLLVRGVVFMFWNFPLQRDYVYGRAGEGKPEPIEPLEAPSDGPITGPQSRA